MKIQENKKYLLLIYMIGFMAGILFANLISKDYIASMGIFHDFFLQQYVQTEIDTGSFFWYLLQIRTGPVLLLGIAGCSRFKKAVAVFFLVWTGLLSGMIMTAAVLQMGMKGILLCMVGLCPHFLFYIAGYAILLWYLFSYPKNRWNLTKTVCTALFMAVGILLECYVNPVLVKLFIGVL